MEARHTTWGATVRLAAITSAVAAVSSMILLGLGVRSQTGLVLSVIVVAFAISWIRTFPPSRQPVPVRATTSSDARRSRHTQIGQIEFPAA